MTHLRGSSGYLRTGNLLIYSSLRDNLISDEMLAAQSNYRPPRISSSANDRPINSLFSNLR